MCVACKEFIGLQNRYAWNVRALIYAMKYPMVEGDFRVKFSRNI